MNDDVAEVNGSAPRIYQALSSTRKSLGMKLYKHGTNKMYRLSKKTGAWKYKKDPSHCWCVSTAPTQSNTEHWHLLLWHHVRNTPSSMHYSGTTICTTNEQRSYLCTGRWKPRGFNWVIFDHWGIIFNFYLSMSYNYHGRNQTVFWNTIIEIKNLQHLAVLYSLQYFTLSTLSGCERSRNSSPCGNQHSYDTICDFISNWGTINNSNNLPSFRRHKDILHSTLLSRGRLSLAITLSQK